MPTRLTKGDPFSQPRKRQAEESKMTTPIPPADSTTTSTNRLIVRLLGEIDTNRQEAVVPAGPSGKLDLARAAATVRRCAQSAGLSPALTSAEAEELARAFIEGDDGPFGRYGAGYSFGPTEESGLEVDEVLVLCALLAAREQWARGAHSMELPTSGSDEPNAVCPACGSLAHLEILLGQYSERYVVCPACDAFWRIPRVGCPHCGEQDGHYLVVYTAEERTERALIHCLSCRRVWRRLELRGHTTAPDDLFIRTFEPWPEELLLDQRDDVLPVPLRPGRAG